MKYQPELSGSRSKRVNSVHRFIFGEHGQLHTLYVYKINVTDHAHQK